MKLMRICSACDKPAIFLAASTPAKQRARRGSRKKRISAGKAVRATRSVLPLPENKRPVGITTRKPKPAAGNLHGSHNRVSVTAGVAEKNETGVPPPQT